MQRFEVFKGTVNSNSYSRHLGTRMCSLVGEIRSLGRKYAFTYGINTCTGCWKQAFLRSVDVSLKCDRPSTPFWQTVWYCCRATLIIWPIPFKPMRNSGWVRSGRERSKEWVRCRSLVGTVGSNPAQVLFWEFCVLCWYRLLQRTDPSSSGFLASFCREC